MDISNNFNINIPNIIFNIDQITTVEIIPDSYYNVNLVDSIKLVVIYNIIYRNNVEIILKARIPYYISDGETNGLRINTLLPFICFYTKEYSNCIDVKYGPHKDNYGLLFKYGLYKNINLNIYNQEIKDLYKSKTTTYNDIVQKNIYTDTIDIIKKSFKGGGLLSFIGRIENLLDLILCLSSYKLNTTSEDDIEDQSLYIPFYYKFIGFIYDESSINPDTKYNIIKYNETFRTPRIKTSINMSDTNMRYTLYRSLLLSKLLELKNNIIGNISTDTTSVDPPNNLFKISYNNININDFHIIDSVHFNKIIDPRICEDGELTINSIKNTINYYSISNIMISSLLEKRPDLKNIIILNELNEGSLRMENTPLDNIVKKWHSECRKNIKH